MAYHSFLLEPISCHAWNKDRTRESAWGSPTSPRGPRALSWLSIRGAGLGLGEQIRPRAALGLGRPIPVSPVPVRDGAGHGPEAAAGEGGSGAEPGDSRAMAFPERGPGDVGEQKELSVLRPRAESRAGGAGWMGLDLGAVHPQPSCSIPCCPRPVLSQPTTPWDHCREGVTLAVGSGVLPSHRDNLQHQGSAGAGLGAWWGHGAQEGGGGCWLALQSL